MRFTNLLKVLVVVLPTTTLGARVHGYEPACAVAVVQYQHVVVRNGLAIAKNAFFDAAFLTDIASIRPEALIESHIRARLPLPALAVLPPAV